MNYIKHLNAAFEKFFFDDRLNPSHISLYMAFFQEWNSSRFATEFFVNRREIMNVAKIGSKSTYHRCVVDLDQWGYLTYSPSNNPYKGSKIKMSILKATDEPDSGQYDPILEQVAEQYHPKPKLVMDHHPPTTRQVVTSHRPISGQALVSNINNTKQENINKQPKDRQAVLIFFKEKGFSNDEGNKFFVHYHERDWRTADKNEVRDWKALAINWMDRAELYSIENRQIKRRAFQNGDNLKTTKKKDYGQPL